MLEVTDAIKKEIHLHKGFLKSLFHAGSQYQKNQILAKASVANLDMLCRICHYLTNSEIPIARFKKDALIKSRRADFLVRNFKSDAAVQRVLDMPREKKIKKLRGIGPWEHLLFSLFFKTASPE